MCQIKDIINSMEEASKFLYDKPRTGPLDIPFLAFKSIMNMLSYDPISP